MSVSADWVSLERTTGTPAFYRKREVYQMQWSGRVDLRSCLIAAAPFGGPIALIRDPTKIVAAIGSDTRPFCRIYSSAGRELSSFLFDKGRIMAMGWNNEEKLAIVIEDGTVYMYDIRGRISKVFSMGPECREAEVTECRIWPGGIVCLTNVFTLWAVTDWNEPRPIRLADPHLDARPLTMEVIPPEQSLSGGVEVLVAPKGVEGAQGSGSLLIVDPAVCQDQALTNGPFARLALSPQGKYLATFTGNGAIWVTTSDFMKNLSEFNTNSAATPRQLTWCGDDAVIAYYDAEQFRSAGRVSDDNDTSLLLMVGPFGSYSKFTYEGPVHLVPECDGIRVITNDVCEFLEKVPECTSEIFQIGSLSPSALLYDAYQEFERQSALSVKTMRESKEKGILTEAVSRCIEAAGHEMDRTLQGNLLKAASYGKNFCEDFDPDQFVKMCKTLRVLNALYEVGIPLTIEQYQRLTPTVVIDRLVNRHKHLLAMRVCEYLGMKPDRVLVHWACAKVRSDEDDHDLRDMIVDKMSTCPSISYAEVAATAFHEGKSDLAIMLLDHEPRAADQVPLLMSMQQDDLALQKAIESGDTDLVYYVLLSIKKRLPPKELFRIVVDKPVARDLLVVYCKEQDIDFLKTFYNSIDQPHEAANMFFLDSFRREKMASPSERMTLLMMARDFYSSKKDFIPDSKYVEEEMDLRKAQLELEEATGQRIFLNSSLYDTMHNCLLLGQLRRAQKLKSDFKVPDKRWWMLRVKALAAQQDWDGLDKFYKEKKPPIGTKPFAEYCIEHNARDEAAKYILRIPEARDKVELFIKIGHYQDAADTAALAKDVRLLEDVYNRCGSKQIQTYIERLMEQIQ